MYFFFPDYFNLSFLVETAQTENTEENEEPFVAPPGLNVPSDVELVCVHVMQPTLLSAFEQLKVFCLVVGLWFFSINFNMVHFKLF